MADTDGTEGAQDMEAPEEEMDDEAALLHFSTYSETRHALPWQQWSTREKANYYMDRIFVGLLVVFLLVVLGEFGYKIWYVTNVKKIAEFVSDLVVFVADWLFTQERQEEQAEL